MGRPHGKFAVVDTTNPIAFAQCDRCGKWRNRTDLSWQLEWAGQHLYNTQVLVCFDTCYDEPNEQLRTIVLPPDPPPVINARPPNFAYEEYGPVQSTLTAFVPQGSYVLPLKSVDGFNPGDYVWVQLNNADFAEMLVVSVDPITNTLTLQDPLPFSAPPTGSVTVSYETPNPSNVLALLQGLGGLYADPEKVSLGLKGTAEFHGVGGFSVDPNGVIVGVYVNAILAGTGSLFGTVLLAQTARALFQGTGTLTARADVALAATALFQGTGSLTAQLDRGLGAFALLQGTGGMVAEAGGRSWQGSALFQGTGSLTAQLDGGLGAFATFNGVGAFVADGFTVSANWSSTITTFDMTIIDWSQG